jgi:hypothetical protein
MAGSPQKRARREAAARAEGRGKQRAKTIDVATREAVVSRAAIIGTAAAAEEFGVKPATVRSWRRRMKSARETVTPLPIKNSAAPKIIEGDPIAQMRATAAHARRLAAECAEQSGPLMRAGQAVKVRELSAAAKMWAATAASLEQAIAVAEGSNVRLDESRAQVMADVIRTFCAEAIGVPVGSAVGSALRELLEQAGVGQPIAVTPARGDAARREARAYLTGTQTKRSMPRVVEAGISRRSCQSNGDGPGNA